MLNLVTEANLKLIIDSNIRIILKHYIKAIMDTILKRELVFSRSNTPSAICFVFNALFLLHITAYSHYLLGRKSITFAALQNDRICG